MATELRRTQKACAAVVSRARASEDRLAPLLWFTLAGAVVLLWQIIRAG